MNDRDYPPLLPPACDDCGHRASLHHMDGGCRALLLGRGTPSKACGCKTTLRTILGARYPRPPAELLERQQAI